MKVFVAGATGAMGAHLIPMLVANGHDVVGTTRSEAKFDRIRAMGALPVALDGLDADAVAQAVAHAEPDVIVHQLTALSREFDMRHFDELFAETNRLRSEGTDHLLAAGRAVGVKRFVAQSFAGWPAAKTGRPLATEDDPFDTNPAEIMRTSLDAIRHCEEAVIAATWTDGIVLRYGGFYGPGTGMALNPPGDQAEMIRKRKFPIVGDGGGVWSFIHIDDAAAATVAAIEHGAPGVYNIVDDEPAPVRQWLPAAAEAVGAKKPRRVPRWLGRLAAGEAGGCHDDRGAGSVECEGQARARLAPALPDLAAGLHARAGAARVTELYEELRPRAFAIAYRMLGSVSEAEDVVQEGFLRLHRVQESDSPPASPGAYLSTIVTRLAIDELRSARRRREAYVGEWLPEPLLTTAEEDDPARHAEIADSLSLAFLVVLESLSPEQRAAFLLHDVFDYPYDEIAEIVGKSEANARQLAARARGHVSEGRPRFESSPEQREELARRFFAAVQEGEVEALEALLAEDVELHGDGGGKVPALARSIHGRERVGRTLRAWAKAGLRMAGVGFEPVEVNGQPGLIGRAADGGILNVMVLDIAGGKVQAIRSIVNPDKLAHLGPVSDLGRVLKARTTD